MRTLSPVLSLSVAASLAELAVSGLKPGGILLLAACLAACNLVTLGTAGSLTVGGVLLTAGLTLELAGLAAGVAMSLGGAESAPGA